MKKVIRAVIMDDDFYSLQTMISLLAWDRRTRVIGSANSPQQLLEVLKAQPKMEPPDVLLLDMELLSYKEADILGLITKVLLILPKASLVCLAQTIKIDLVELVFKHGVKAYLIKDEVGFGLASAVVYSAMPGYVVTESIFEKWIQSKEIYLNKLKILPGPRNFPELSHRVELAMRYYVIAGMPAELTADEMGVSENTIRTFVQQASNALHGYDDNIVTLTASNKERLFQQYTSLRQTDDRE